MFLIERILMAIDDVRHPLFDSRLTCSILEHINLMHYSIYNVLSQLFLSFELGINFHKHLFALLRHVFCTNK